MRLRISIDVRTFFGKPTSLNVSAFVSCPRAGAIGIRGVGGGSGVVGAWGVDCGPGVSMLFGAAGTNRLNDGTPPEPFGRPAGMITPSRLSCGRLLLHAT